MFRSALSSCVLVLASLACAPGKPSGDEVGDTGETTESGATESGSTDSGDTESTTESTTESGDTESTSDTTESTTDTTDTGEPIPLCTAERGESLWSLPCPGCERLNDTNGGLYPLDVVGSQIPTDILECGHFQFEGTVLDHPSPSQWVVDACPCAQLCLVPDPHTIDLAADGLPHPSPERLPSDLGQCVRVDVWKSGSVGGETACRPEALALWNLDGNQPVLSYAQGGSTDYAFPIDLGDLDVDAPLDCELNGPNSATLRTRIYTFAIGASSVDVPAQTSATLMTPVGDYEAINIAAQSYVSEIDSEFELYWWALTPQP